MSRRSRGDGQGRRGPGTGDAGIELRDGAAMGELNFRAASGSDFDFIVFQVLGDRFERLGLAVGEVTAKHEVNTDGMFIEVLWHGQLLLSVVY